MWERLVHSPHGRMSVRKFIMSLATLFVACFLFISSVSPTVFAVAAASWSGSNISYEGNTYTPFTPQPGDGLSSDTTYYKFGPQSGSNVAKFIIFDANTDPKSATKASWQNYTVSGGKYTNPSHVQPITLNPAANLGSSNSPPVGSDGEEATSTECDLSGIGWIVCPVSKFLATSMDWIYNIVASFFDVKPLTTDSHGIFPMWELFRNMANVAFVIASLIVIYGQITGGMMTNYTIKKLLPRIIVAAIFVNISYWICAVAVDLSNILGHSVIELFTALRDIAGPPTSNATSGGVIATWTAVTAVVLGGTKIGVAGTAAVLTASGGTISGFALLLLTALLPAIFAVIVAVAILAARQALITVFIILSPLAFVAYILPNTEDWFKRWRKTFTVMLIMFPAFSAVFGGAQLAGTLIIRGANPDNKVSALTTIILGLAVQVVPLFITPFLIRFSSGIMGTVANMANDRSKGLFDRTRNWANTRRSQEQARGRARMYERAKRRGYVDGHKTLDKNGRPLNRGRRFANRVLNPYDRAYYWDYKRTEREEAKSKHEELAAGYFSQTTAGQRNYNIGRDAGLEKHAGESANAHSYNTAMATGTSAQDVYRRNLYNQAHINEGVGKLYEESLTNAADRTLQAQINNPAGPLRNIKISANVDAAHAKLDAEEVESAGKRAFSMEFDGSSAAAKALHKQRYRIIENNKVSETIESTLNKRGEERWQRITQNTADPQFDAALRTLRLEEIEASTSHKEAETQWNELIENIRLNGANTPTITSPADRTAAGRIRRSTENTVSLETAIEDIKTTSQSRAQNRFLESQAGRQLNVRAQAAKDSLEATRSREAARAQEWRTTKGAEGLTGEEAQIARELRNADIQKKAQTQRTSNATGVANLEYATQIQDESTGLAAVAGGIDDYGARRAQASATQTIIDDFTKNVGSEKSTMSKLNDDELYRISTDENESNERRAAAAGKIMQGGAMRTIHKLINKMAETVPDDGTEESKKKRGAVRDIQMQMAGDMSRVPFGMGDTDRSTLRRGELGQLRQVYDADGNPVVRDGVPVMAADPRNIEDMTVVRARAKLSGDTWASMDPDDRAELVRLAESPEGREKLGQEGRTALLRSFNEATRETINIRDDAKRDANRIAAAFGVNAIFDMGESGGSTAPE